MRKMLFTAAALCASAASAAGLDGVSFTTNDWFDASFTSLSAGTLIETNTVTGITRGAGSWTAAPTNGTAVIAADEDAGGGATLLSLSAPGEELTFTPAPLASATGFETFSVDVKAEAVEEISAMDSDVQAAFTLYDDGESVTAIGYTADGWTNLVYAADTLTNAWTTMYVDFATIDGVRCVRYSVKPSSGSLTVLADSAGETWFPRGGSSATLNSVSFSGTGSCRTLSGDSLADIPAAEVNGISYSTVNAAIAAANAGDTVTLTRAIDGMDVAVTKNLTLALGSYNLTAGGFSVANGVTLTVTGSGTISAAAITGGGSLAFSNAATLNLKGGSSSLAAITAASSLTVTGNGTVNVVGDVDVEGTLTFTPDAYSTAVAESHGAYTIKMSAATISSGTLAGGAYLETTGGISVGGASSFYGTIAGLGGVTATGARLDLLGAGTFTGTLAVNGGVVRIDSSLTGIAHSFRLDASVADSIVTSEGGYVTNWVSQSGTLPAANSCFTNEASAMVVTDAYFGGKNAVLTSTSRLFNGYFTGANNNLFASHFVGAVRLVSQSGGGAMLWSTAVNNLMIGRRGEAANLAYWTKMLGSGTEVKDDIWQNGVYGNRSYTYEETTLAFLNFNRNNKAAYGALGGGAANLAIGELIAFTSAQGKPNIETLHRIETYLANKWGVDGVAKSLAEAPVVLTSGGVLDLGGTAQTIASLSGSGVVSNGTLTVTEPISVAVGSTLVIPYGSTYTCAVGTGANVDTTASTVTFLHKAADIDGIVYETVQDAFDAYESGTLTIYEDATGIDLGTTARNISGIVLADGVSAPTFSTTLPWQTTYSEGTLWHTRVASTFVYVGPTAYNPVASNFEIGGVAASDAPGTSDTVQFDTDITITTSSTSYRYEAVVVNADVTLNGGNNSYYLNANLISGTGKLALGNYAKIATQSGAGTISCELGVDAEGASTAAQLYVAASGREITLTGVLSGSGYLKCTRAKNASDYSGCTFHCSNAIGFVGTIEMVRPDDGVGRNIITFWPTCDLSGATVIKGTHQNNSGSGRGRFIDGQSNSTVYKFGSLSGYVWPAASSVANSHPTIEIGALNRDDTITGNWMPHNDRNPYIRKVGTGTLTTTAANAYGYILNGGTLKVLATDTAPVATEVKGLKPVCETETIDEVEYKVYTLKASGAMFLVH